MHYHAEVWIPHKENVEAQVAKAMASHREEYGGTLWDWYQIGGRWKGIHNPNYKQEGDPDHLIPCSFCDATGLRKDMGYWENGEKIFKDEWARQCNGCNVCKGTGKEVLWPTKWISHPKDVLPVSEIPESLQTSTLSFQT